MPEAERVYRFGEFQLDAAARLLRRGEETVHVEARVLDLLLYLVEQRGRTVSRSELTRALWGSLQVSDGSLRRTVSLLRKALDARGPTATTVETVHGRGYRFAAPVSIDSTASPTEGPDGSGPSRASSRPSSAYRVAESVPAL